MEELPHPKRFVNNRETVVQEAIDGLLSSRKGYLSRLDGFPGTKVVIRGDWNDSQKKKKVALISGGGAGHEPAHAGFVGEGLLTAGVSGEIFASPTVDAVLAAILAVTGPKGCLLIVKNYTGDRLNFGLAAEKAKSEHGLRVKIVIVGDDVSLLSKSEKENLMVEGNKAVAGYATQVPLGTNSARGLAGTLLVHKVAGAAAESGAMLDEVYREALEMSQRVKTMGVSFSTCTQPFSLEGRSLGGHIMEFGLGIHGEPGVRKQPVDKTDVIVQQVMDEVLDFVEEFPDESSEEQVECDLSEGKYDQQPTPADSPGIPSPDEDMINIPEEVASGTGQNGSIIGSTGGSHQSKSQKKKPVVVLVNNLGGVPPIEMTIIANCVLKNIGRRRCYMIGPAPLMTSLDMNGFSISIATVTEKILSRLQSKCGNYCSFPPLLEAASINLEGSSMIIQNPLDIYYSQVQGENNFLFENSTNYPALAEAHKKASEMGVYLEIKNLQTSGRKSEILDLLINSACNALIHARDELNDIDSKVGDGDTGTQMSLGAQAILHIQPPTGDLSELCCNISRILSRTMGGTSGVLLSIFFSSLAQKFQELANNKIGSGKTDVMSVQDVMIAFRFGVQKIQDYGGARLGDRTLLDALIPASEASSYDEIYVRAKNGAESTRDIGKAGAGRSQYIVDSDYLLGIPDPGAHAVMLVFKAMQECFL